MNGASPETLHPDVKAQPPVKRCTPHLKKRAVTRAAITACLWICATVANATGFPFVPSSVLDPGRVNVLSGADAQRHGEFHLAAPLSHLKTEVIGWQDQHQSLSWTVDVAEDAEYAVTALLSIDTQAVVTLTVSAASTSTSNSTSAPFQVDARGFQSRSHLHTPLLLTKGRHVVTLRLTPTPRDAPFQAELLALELVRPALRAALHAQALALRADARWLARETFGVGFHWTKRTMPRWGPAKPYAQAVADFDVERFAAQVASTGASFVFLTTSHSDQYLPAPIAALDAILPGRTARRDLIADLIAALGKRNMKLFLYYHLGPIEDPAWSQATHLWNSNPTRFFANWQAIIAEMGQRYGKGLAGWWFDDGVYNYHYRSPDWAALAAAAKAGNAERAVCFNSWKAASATRSIEDSS